MLTTSESGQSPKVVNAKPSDEKAALVVVGTGIQWAGQTTFAARQSLESADCVLFAVADPWTAGWLRSVCPKAESLPYPRDGRARKLIYDAMVGRILDELRADQRVCAVFYGSPALLTRPAHQAVREARAAGFPAQMLPGVSTFECLCADVGIDGGEAGCQLYEAGDILMRSRQLDRHSHLVLFQIAMIGNGGAFDRNSVRIRHTLALLAERLMAVYSPDHAAVIYEAASHPLQQPRIESVPLSSLHQLKVREVSTLYVPPVGPAPIDEEMKSRLMAGVRASQSANAQKLQGEQSS